MSPKGVLAQPLLSGTRGRGIVKGWQKHCGGLQLIANARFTYTRRALHMLPSRQGPGALGRNSLNIECCPVCNPLSRLAFQRPIWASRG